MKKHFDIRSLLSLTTNLTFYFHCPLRTPTLMQPTWANLGQPLSQGIHVTYDQTSFQAETEGNRGHDAM